MGWAVGGGLARPTGPTGGGRDALPGQGLFPGRWGPDRLAQTPTPAVSQHIAWKQTNLWEVSSALGIPRVPLPPEASGPGPWTLDPAGTEFREGK